MSYFFLQLGNACNFHDFNYTQSYIFRISRVFLSSNISGIRGACKRQESSGDFVVARNGHGRSNLEWVCCESH